MNQGRNPLAPTGAMVVGYKARLTSPNKESNMEAVPNRGARTRQQASNFVHGLKQSPVKRVLVNGLHMAFVNTTAAFTTEFLNFYLESRGLNQRRIAMMPVPNPDKGTPTNALSRKVG